MDLKLNIKDKMIPILSVRIMNKNEDHKDMDELSNKDR